jgi:hypothetical protein
VGENDQADANRLIGGHYSAFNGERGMSGYDITDELRINWDDSVKPRLPFYSCSGGYEREAILAVITARIEAKRRTLEDMEAWLAAYLDLPEDQHRDWKPEPATYKKRQSRKR